MQLIVFLLAALAAAPAFAQSSPLLDILTQELDRNFSTFKQKADPAPYFMGYSVVDEQSDVIAGRLGVLQAKNHGHSRSLDITIRVGTPKFDNYHIVGGERATFTSGSAIPIEDNPDAIKRRLWIETDRNFRGASQRLTNLRTSTKVNVAAEDLSDDFSVEPPSVYVEPVKHMPVNTEEWAAKVRKWSGELSKYSGVLSGGVTVLFENQTKYLVTTEGTRLQHGRGFARIVISAQGKASDGMDLSASDTFEAEQATGLPDEAVVIAAVNKVG
jgi:TldD protein